MPIPAIIGRRVTKKRFIFPAVAAVIVLLVVFNAPSAPEDATHVPVTVALAVVPNKEDDFRFELCAFPSPIRCHEISSTVILNPL